MGQKVQVRYIIRDNKLYDAQVLTKESASVNYFQWGVLGVLALVFGGIGFVCIRSLYQMKTGTWKG
ncbi:MAG: hypothetical protein GY754_24405 [bacterium]|nr:hypothetical protein [bacterium]